MHPEALTILLVENDAEQSRVLLGRLTDEMHEGCSFFAADSLRHGLALLQTEAIDVVLLDLNLPDSQGLDTLEAMREHIQRLAVIVLTEQADEAFVQKAVEYGAQDYLVKGEINVPGLARNLRHAVERKRTEVALQQALDEKTSLAAAIESVTAGVIICNARLPDWPIVFSNPALTDMTGYQAKEIMGRNCRFLQGPQSDRSTVAQIRAALLERRSFHGVLLNYRKDGTTFWNELTINPVHDVKGFLTHYVGVQTDISVRMATEEALRESEERFRVLVESARDFGILSLDLAGRVTTWNSGAEQIFGYTAAEMIGHSGDLTFTEEDRANGQPQLEQETALREGRAADERWHRRKDGSRFWGSGVMMPLHRDGDSAAQGFIKILRDLTQTHLVQEERARLLEAERAASESKDHFLAVLSHELRTPLTPITMSLHLLSRRSDLPDVAHKALAMIQRNVELETRFIDDLLDVTRLSRGKMEIVREPMDLHEAARHAVEVSAPDFQAKGQTLSVVLEAASARVNGDAARLQQALWNLLKNASKFTPQGGAVSLRSRDAPGQIVLEVADSGIGLEAEALERIFEPFEQADRAITRKFGGLGLGLAIAKATVEAHGGTLRASSAGNGQGATFTLELPLWEPAASPESLDS